MFGNYLKAMILKTCIVASGESYQESAAWAAATYRMVMPEMQVVVLVPSEENEHPQLISHRDKFGFAIARFEFAKVSDKKLTSQLKCQGFLNALNHIERNEILLLADADTVCCRPIILGEKDEKVILSGSIGMAVDVRDRHTNRRKAPWFLPRDIRQAYVNSGVIFSAAACGDMFLRFEELSRTPNFLRGPFNDQKVINYALGKYFPGRLVVLDPRFNGLRRRANEDTVIKHFAGGAGKLNSGQGRRKRMHQEACAAVVAAY